LWSRAPRIHCKETVSCVAEFANYRFFLFLVLGGLQGLSS